jgi:hypothetical protein
LSERITFGEIGSPRAQSAGRGAAVITVIAADSSSNPAGFGLSGTRGIVGVEVAAATEVPAPSSLGGGRTKRGIDDDEAFRDSGLDGPSAVTTDSAAAWVVVTVAGTRGIVGVEVAAATEVSAPSSLGGGRTKRGIDDDEAFRDSGLDGPSAVTTDSAAAWVVVTVRTLTTAGATVELSLLANLYKMRSVPWQQHLKLILQWVDNLAAKKSELVLCA